MADSCWRCKSPGERRVYGRVAAVLGMLVEIAGIDSSLSIGARCELVDRSNRRIGCEIVGFRPT